MTCATIEQPITTFPEFSRYRRELGHWIARDADDLDDLEAAGAALCHLARGMAIRPEEILVALHAGGPGLELAAGSDRLARERQARAHRQALATNLLLRTYFT
jgi:hypothetical protein